MSSPVFTIKIYRNGLKQPSSVEFHPVATPRVVDLTNKANDFDIELHKEFVDKGATHAIDVVVNDKVDHLYLFQADVMFIESPQGETIFSVNRKTS